MQWNAPRPWLLPRHNDRACRLPHALDLSGMSRTLTIGSFVGGLVLWTLGTALVFGSVAAIYNRLVTQTAAVQRVTAGRSAPQAA